MSLFSPKQIILVLSFPLALWQAGWRLRSVVWPEQHKWLLFARGAFHTIFVLVTFYAYRIMPLGDVTMILCTGPVAVACLAWYVLGEPCGVFEVMNTIVALAGMVMVVQPPFIFGEEDTQEKA